MGDVTAFVSVLPGRIRLRHPLLRDAARHQALADRLRRLADVEGNPATGSLLLRFDPADTGVDARIRAEVAAALPAAALAATPSPPARAARRPRKASVKWGVNRAAKAGAVTSMVVSLAALSFSKRLHAQAGMASVALMLVHMAVHWRRILK